MKNLKKNGIYRYGEHHHSPTLSVFHFIHSLARVPFVQILLVIYTWLGYTSFAGGFVHISALFVVTVVSRPLGARWCDTNRFTIAQEFSSQRKSKPPHHVAVCMVWRKWICRKASRICVRVYIMYGRQATEKHRNVFHCFSLVVCSFIRNEIDFLIVYISVWQRWIWRRGWPSPSIHYYVAFSRKILTHTLIHITQ